MTFVKLTGYEKHVQWFLWYDGKNSALYQFWLQDPWHGNYENIMIHKNVQYCWGPGKKEDSGIVQGCSRKILSYLQPLPTAFKILAAVDMYLEACQRKSFTKLHHTAASSFWNWYSLLEIAYIGYIRYISMFLFYHSYSFYHLSKPKTMEPSHLRVKASLQSCWASGASKL